MPRPPRYPLIGVPQHVIQRGNNRQPTFFIEDDFRFYLEYLKGAATNHHCGLQEIRESLNQCRVLGSERFKDEIEAALSRRVRPGKPGRPKTKVEPKAEIPV